MISRLILSIGVALTACAATGSLRAEELAGAPSPSAAVRAPATPEAQALRGVLARLAAGDTDEERGERAALVSFYEARGYAPLWLTQAGALNPKASLVAAEIKRADDWGLDARDFALPAGLEKRGADGVATPKPETLAADETAISLAVLKYGRYARGGRIMKPSEQLSSYLDRRPQLLKPQAVLDGIAAAEASDAYLRGLNPAHPQFEKLRQKYLAISPGRRKSTEAKRLIANMEQWRWMPADMGSVYVWNNVPDFTQRVVKNGETVRKVRIVAGELDKQTAIFSRSLKKITFKPTWIVPDSIKVRELWPSLLKGGGLMRKWALEVRTKEGALVNWHKVNWSKADIREYDVIQPNGPKTVLGKVKFTFPSQHTIFMHDTRAPDKWMFNSSRRTYSHGCMRVADPIGLAKIVLREDKGWDAARVTEAFETGPLNNAIDIEHKIPVHQTYFTALVEPDGSLQTFPDVYGHEQRIRMALDGKWDQIVKGRDHLAPVELTMADAAERSDGDSEPVERAGWHRRTAPTGGGRGLLDSLFGGDGL